LGSEGKQNRRIEIKLWILIGAILVSLAFLIYINIYIFTSVNPNITLTFEGESEASVFDGELVFITEYNQTLNLNVFSIYGLNVPPPDPPSISDLREINSGTKISSDDIILTVISPPSNITPKNPMRITFSLRNNMIPSPGLYQGTLFITAGANVASIPITLDVKPNLAQPTILVVDGIVISIAFWNLIAYLNAKYDEVIIKTIKGRDGRGEIIDERYQAMRDNLKKYVTSNPVVLNNAILNIGTISFGIALGIIGLPSSGYINNLHSIGPFEALTLIGIGLGIGSLKEFVPKNKSYISRS
jgi:uncharacterized membrane protein